ncbi:MAG: GNAT family N-acetyltransferase [Clostridium sp.]|uniref:GNAT family N-acetyltransferase n=1 Tax=Clostridium sp. TaxID=1506 RepID=UPI003F2E3C81
MNIQGKFVTLRAIEESDMELLEGMLNDSEIEKMVMGWAFPISKFQQRKWFENSSQDQKNIRLIIETENDGAVGLVTLIDIDWKNRVASQGIKLVNKEYRGRGIGTDAVMTMMKYAFEELQLNRLDGAIIEYNEASKNLYCNKCGWKIEGVQRKRRFKNNKYHDNFIIGILKEEYEELVNENKYWGNIHQK